MKQTLEQLGLTEGKVSFNEYEYYGNKYMENNMLYMNSVLRIEVEDKIYVFFTGANYRDSNTKVSGLLEENEVGSLDEPITESMVVKDYNDDVLEKYNKLLEDNYNWLEEEVSELAEKYGVYINLSLSRDEVTEHTVAILSNTLAKAQDILEERKTVQRDLKTNTKDYTND